MPRLSDRLKTEIEAAIDLEGQRRAQEAFARAEGQRMTPERYVEHNMSGDVIAEWTAPEPGCFCDECAALAEKQRLEAEKRALEPRECRGCGTHGRIAGKELCSTCLELDQVRRDLGTGHARDAEWQEWRKRRDRVLRDLERTRNRPV